MHTVSESGENITVPKLSHSNVNDLCLTVLTGFLIVLSKDKHCST